MKIKSLIPTLGVIVFAATASAQSDPSVGGTFAGMHGRSGSSGMEQIASPSMAIATSISTKDQSHLSFWNRLTGRKAAETRGTAFRPVQNRGWFGQHRSTNYTPAQHRSWFGLHHNPPAAQTRTTRVSTTASTRSNGWHMPFFSRR